MVNPRAPHSPAQAELRCRGKAILEAIQADLLGRGLDNATDVVIGGDLRLGSLKDLPKNLLSHGADSQKVVFNC